MNGGSLDSCNAVAETRMQFVESSSRDFASWQLSPYFNSASPMSQFIAMGTVPTRSSGRRASWDTATRVGTRPRCGALPSRSSGRRASWDMATRVGARPRGGALPSVKKSARDWWCNFPLRLSKVFRRFLVFSLLPSLCAGLWEFPEARFLLPHSHLAPGSCSPSGPQDKRVKWEHRGGYRSVERE